MNDEKHYVVVVENDTCFRNLVHVLELHDDLPRNSSNFVCQYCERRFNVTEQLKARYPGKPVIHYFADTSDMQLAPGVTVHGLHVTEGCVMERRNASEFLS